MGGRGARSGLVLKSNSLMGINQDGYIKSLLDKGEISKRLSIQKQNKHIPGKKEYETYTEQRRTKGKDGPQSIIYLDYKEIQDLIDKYAGTAPHADVREAGATLTEFFTADKVVGQYYNRKVGRYVETTRFAIFYAKKGAHVVPVWPNPNG